MNCDWEVNFKYKFSFLVNAYDTYVYILDILYIFLNVTIYNTRKLLGMKKKESIFTGKWPNPKKANFRKNKIENNIPVEAHVFFVWESEVNVFLFMIGKKKCKNEWRNSDNAIV